MGTRIVITENQYKRLFLGEQQSYPERNCSYMLDNDWVNEYDAPFYYQLKDPFGDGYDYAWWVWDNCTRSWIRRKKEFRKNTIQNYLSDWDFSWNPSDSDNQKLNKKKKEDYNRIKKGNEEYTSPENIKKEIDRVVANMKSKGWTIKRYGGDNPKPDDLPLTEHMSILYTIRDIVQNGSSWNPRFDAIQGGQSCLRVKTSDIGTYSMDNAQKYQDQIDKTKNSTTKVPYMVYLDNDELPRREYKTITNVPGNTYFLESFYYTDAEWKAILDDVSYIKYGNYNTKLFPNGSRAFMTTWFGTDEVKKFKSDSFNASEPGCNGNGYKSLTFISKRASADVSVHDVLQIAAAVAWFIPGGQPVALGLELIDAGIYVYEGDYFGGVLGVLLTAAPMLGPLFRKIGRTGIKKVEKSIIEIEEHISKSKLSKEEFENFVKTQKTKHKLNKDESKALDEILSNSKKVDGELTKIKNMGRSERTKYLKTKSIEFDEIWNKNVGYGKGSRYWERQIDMKSWERLVVPSVIIGAVVAGNISTDDAVTKLNNVGYENITSSDLESLKKDAKGLFERVAKHNPDTFKLATPEEHGDIYDVNSLFKITDEFGTDSTIYQNYVKPNIPNVRNSQYSKVLYDIYNIIESDKELSELEYRKLDEDVDYRWYDILQCKEDPYNKRERKITDSISDEEFQNEIDFYGDPLDLRGDAKYTYMEYDGLWYWKEKDDDTKLWKLVKNCLGCSKLQRTLNREYELIKNKFDYEMEFNYDYNKKNN